MGVVPLHEVAFADHLPCATRAITAEPLPASSLEPAVRESANRSKWDPHLLAFNLVGDDLRDVLDPRS
jgi:hypothetical protein